MRISDAYVIQVQEEEMEEGHYLTWLRGWRSGERESVPIGDGVRDGHRCAECVKSGGEGLQFDGERVGHAVLAHHLAAKDVISLQVALPLAISTIKSIN